MDFPRLETPPTTSSTAGRTISALHLLLEPVENIWRGLIARFLMKSTSEMHGA